MSQHPIDDLLPLVAKPSRYLGTETNVVRKDHSRTDLSVVLAFPDLYEIGMSHFGLQILYHVLNRDKRIAAERVFAPDLDMVSLLRSTGIPLPSLESKTPLDKFDIIGFSLLYELNYTNILSILELSNIPFAAGKRDDRYPLIIAGGPCTCNPEPVAELFDAMVVGDGEEVIVEMAQTWLRWKDSGQRDRKQLLDRWSEIQGVYIPSFFAVTSDPSGIAVTSPKKSAYQQVRKAAVAGLDDAPFPDRPVVPFGRPIHDRLRMELARGCTRGCRFCQAGMIYRPVRERSMESLLSLVREAIGSTGYEDLSLLSLSTGDYECIEPLMQRLMERCTMEQVAVSLPSLRVDTLTPELMNLIKRVRKTGFTIAPEAGSQRLRNVINKNVDQDEIISTVKNAFDLGWQVIKLYFMIGLPTETMADLQAIVDLVEKLRRISRSYKRRGRLNVSVATFIPKPHTPFQWSKQISLEESNLRIQWLQERLRKPDIRFKWQNPQVSQIEGLWARGDRNLLPLLIRAYQLGCRFDGWTDHFRYERWMEACRNANIDIDFYAGRFTKLTDPLPWDHIDSGVTKDFLWQEWQRSQSGELTPDCRHGECNDCGVCDFDILAPRVHALCAEQAADQSREAEPAAPPVQYRMAFSKTGSARYFGHLEMANLFMRAIRRAGIAIAYSKGFHPKPKIRFGDALPLGLESRCEELQITIDGQISCRDLQERINSQLPDGLTIHHCTDAKARTAMQTPSVTTYRVRLSGGSFPRRELEQFHKQERFIITRAGPKKKVRSVDLCEVVDHIELTRKDTLEISIRKTDGFLLRPAEILLAIFSLQPDSLARARIVKTAVR